MYQASRPHPLPGEGIIQHMPLQRRLTLPQHLPLLARPAKCPHNYSLPYLRLRAKYGGRVLLAVRGFAFISGCKYELIMTEIKRESKRK